jgi:hemolysin activation/secretion protein
MRKKYSQFRLALIMGLGFVYSTCIYAQARGNPIDTLPPVSTPQEKKPEVNVAKPDAANELVQKILAVQLTPSKFSIEGVKSIPFNEVSSLYTPLVGKSITVADIIKVTNEINQLYKNHGYALSFGFVPGQNFKDGVVKIVVVEGYVKNVIFKEDDVKKREELGMSRSRVLAIASAIKEDKPLTQAKFERVINLLNQEPGMTIEASISPPTNTDGATDMVLTVKRKKFSFNGGIQFKDPGMQALLGFTFNSLTPFGDQTTFTTLQPRGHDQEDYYSGSYSQDLGHNGLRFKVEGYHYRAHPESDPLALLGYNNRYLNELNHMSVNLMYPFILDNKQNLTGTLTMYMNNARQKYDPQEQYQPYIGSTLINNHTRVVDLDMAYTRKSDTNLQNVDLGLYKGIDGLGASHNYNLNDLSFFKTKLQYTEVHVFNQTWGVKFSAIGQYSSNRLVDNEQLSFGSFNYGMGYAAGEVSGDKGYGFSLEANKSFLFGMKYLKSIQPYVYFDNAKVYSNSGPMTHDHLTSVALGVRLSDKKYYNLDMNIAKPMGDKPIDSNNRSPRFNFIYSYQFD